MTSTSTKVNFQLKPMDDHDDDSVRESGGPGSSMAEFTFHDEGKGAEEKEVIKQIASKESRQVRATKLLVGIVLAASAACAGGFTYMFMSGQEQAEFERKFEGYASELIHVSGTKAVDTFAHTAAFGNEITSMANYGNMEWPFFTMDDFHVRASDYAAITGSASTTLCPIVPEKDRAAWASYTMTNMHWFNNSQKYLNMSGSGEIAPVLWSMPNGTFTPVTTPGPVTTVWQSFPPSATLINFHLESTPLFTTPQAVANKDRRGVLTALSAADAAFFDAPTSIVFEPIFRNFEKGADIIAYLSMYFPWTNFFENILSEDSSPVICVVSNPCGSGRSFTLEIVGPDVNFVGHDDLHDPKQDNYGISGVFAGGDSKLYPDPVDGQPACLYNLRLYPTTQMKSEEVTSLPIMLTIGALAVFLFTSIVFVMYDVLVQRQNRRIASTVQKSTELVSLLFPAEYRERLFGNENGGGEFMRKITAKSPSAGKRKSTVGLDNLGGDDEDDGPEMYATAPVADLFPDCTVLEADIAGFTAWSSTREPTMVFELLETLYAAFDDVAERRRVFKVETIGDSYVAVAGLPTPRRDHAVVMIRFAHDCLVKMNTLVAELEVKLGPGTSNLAMRFGLHSGSVTAGVLRGDGLRFQLFGDTLNMSEEMEKNGERNKIHISEQTADLLKKAGKSHWLQARPSKVYVRSKGDLQTYFVFPKSGNNSSTNSSSVGEGNLRIEGTIENKDEGVLDAKSSRLVDWNVQILTKLLKQVIATRQANSCWSEELPEPVSEKALGGRAGTTVLDEVKEIVRLPKYSATEEEVNADNIKLSPDVQEQLHDFVYSIGLGYRANPFHNFEHASHVTMSATKLLSRIVAPQSAMAEACDLHDNTYGITSDPLTQFGVVLSALIHDLDHSGVPNASLVKEADPLAKKYKNKSVAEQNSVDLAWSLLMDKKYEELRKCIYTSQSELERFRSIVINVVLATDIADKDLGAARKQRWNKAFKLGDAANHVDEDPHDEVNRKATIVIEHLIQASDIAHTMQHWHVYRKWNERLFREMYEAYAEGRLATDPSDAWYEGEMGFFDFYIIPLAKKLKDCGVFGVSSDEYLNYATQNRNEWKERGREVVAGYVQKYVVPSDEVSL